LIDQFGSGADEMEMIDAGAAPTLENYQYFTVDRQGLNILFAPYQVGPGSAGTPKVSISYDLLGSNADGSSSSTVPWWLQ
jgi:hypothetical protein